MIASVFLRDFVGWEKPEWAGFTQYKVVLGIAEMENHGRKRFL
jgi:hypothetical protein